MTNTHDMNDNDHNVGDVNSVDNIDDPRLTAWALGELEGADAEAVAAFVNNSSEARAEVAQIRELAGMLGGELTTEAQDENLTLDHDRRAALVAALGDQGGGGSTAIDAAGDVAGDDASHATPAPRRPTLMTRLRPFMAVAALLLVAVFVVDLMRNGGANEGLRPAGDSSNAEGLVVVAETNEPDLRQLGYLGSKGKASDQSLNQLESLGYSSRGGSPQSGSSLNGGFQKQAAKPSATRGYAAATGKRETQPDESVLLQMRALGYVGGAGDDSSDAALGLVSDQPALSSAPGHAAMEQLVIEEPALALEEPVLHEQLASREASALNRTARLAGEAVADAAVEAETLSRLKALGYLGDTGKDDYDTQGLLTGRGRKAPRRDGGDRYEPIVENPFVPITSEALSALSTFGIDVDTASYANVRRFLHRNQLPPANSVRLEELINYFAYDDPQPDGDVPFASTVEVASCPWEPGHRLVRVALQGKTVSDEERVPTQLVFLLDVSGSMNDSDKLPLLIKSFELLLQDMDAEDKVAIVTYASGTELVLPPTSCSEKQTILSALHGLSAGGSTHASAGIQMAYEVATDGFIEGGNNRILLATDGDFNVGVTSSGGLYDLIRAKAASGVFLTVLGFGTGNLNDATAELLADNGNGNYAYIDSLTEAHKVLVAERDGTLVTIAKDVKLQVEFNPGKVAAYRLLGYENRILAATDFRDDKKDAGEIGAGHSVVALYEVVPRGVEGVTGTVEMKYQQLPEPESFVDSPELLTVNLRWKRPDAASAREAAVPVIDRGRAFGEASEELRFSSAVAAFGMILRGSRHAGNATMAWVVETADNARSFDPLGDRSEFVRLARTAQGLLR